MSEAREKRILLVEDDREVLFMVGAALRQAGYKVETAQRRQLAEWVLKHSAIDLVISDSVLLDGNGDLVIRSVDLPVILMSGDPSRIEALERGTRPFIAKPFRVSGILPLIKAALGAAPAAAAEGPGTGRG